MMDVAMFGFLFAIGLLTLHANLSDPVQLDAPLFFGAAIVFLLYTAYGCVKFFRAFRIPRDDGGADGVGEG